MSIWTDLWELFFPKYCVVCGKRLLQTEEYLCVGCLSALPQTKMHEQRDNEMEKNLWGKLAMERASAFLYYTKGGDVRQLLYELKYYGNSDLGLFLGRWMSAQLLPSGFFQGIDGIVPVPLHDKKFKKRGYNQSEKLAEGVSAITNIPVFRQVLMRKEYTETQTHKSNYERWTNVKDVFLCANEEDLVGKHILLVDDVFTTGATMVACADALGQIPGLRISVLTLALAGEH